jgi:hypothetical protein
MTNKYSKRRMAVYWKHERAENTYTAALMSSTPGVLQALSDF